LASLHETLKKIYSNNESIRLLFEKPELFGFLGACPEYDELSSKLRQMKAETNRIYGSFYNSDGFIKLLRMKVKRLSDLKASNAGKKAKRQSFRGVVWETKGMDLKAAYKQREEGYRRRFKDKYNVFDPQSIGSDIKDLDDYFINNFIIKNTGRNILSTTVKDLLEGDVKELQMQEEEVTNKMKCRFTENSKARVNGRRHRFEKTATQISQREDKAEETSALES